MPFPVVAVVTAVASFVAQSLLNRRNLPKPGKLDDFDFPTVDGTRSIPVFVGKNKQDSPIVLWWGDFRAQKLKISLPWWFKVLFGAAGSETVVNLLFPKPGYRYHIGMVLGLGFGPNVVLRKITMGDKVVFDGTQGAGTVTITKEKLFGGEGTGSEGGINTILDFYSGSGAQTENAYFDSQVGLVSGHRGVSYAVWRGPSAGVIDIGDGKTSLSGYVGTSTFLKPIAFYVDRYPDYLNTATHIIGEDANPADFIYELCINKLYGAGISSSRIDSASFIAAAQTLYDEGFGMSMIWERGEPIEDFLQRLLNYIDATLYTDLSTGLLTLKLIRDDYDPLTIPSFNDDDIIAIESYSRGSWKETTNEIRVNFTNRADDYKSTPALAQDLANQRIRNETDTETVDYPMCNVGTLAQRVAFRDLRVASLPLAKGALVFNRKGASLLPGFPFKWSTTKLDPPIVNKIMRASRADYGKIGEGAVKIDCIEDVFALGPAIYTPPVSGFVDPITDPLAASPIIVLEQPFLLSGDEYRVWSFVPRPNGSHLSYDAYVSTDAGTTYTLRDVEVEFTPLGTLFATYNQLTADVDPTGFELVNVGDLGELINVAAADIVASGSNLLYFEDTGELAAFETVTFNSGTGRYALTNIWRGLMDSVPTAHASGSRVWLVSYGRSVPVDAYSNGQALKLKHLTRTPRGELALADAVAQNLTIAQRSLLPYPPAGFTVEGSYITSTIPATGDIDLAWKHRDRLTQTTILKQTDADVGPEAGITYTLKIRNQSNTLLRTVTGISGNTYTYLNTDETADNGGSLATSLKFEIYSVRSGLESAHYNRTVTR